MRTITLPLMLVVSLASACFAAQEHPMPASSDFAIDLYHQLDSQPGNLFFSPLSIRSALAMTAAGARGKTLEQMLTVLRMNGKDPQAAMGDLLRQLSAEPKEQTDQPKLVLRIANAIWGQEKYPFNPAFVNLLKDQYSAQAESLNFSNEPAARKEINDWVAEKTTNKIRDLIPAGFLHPDTRLVLTNAVYFYARWAEEFNENQTSDQPFHVTSDKTTSVAMMRKTARFGYADNPDFQAIELPYAGGETSMLILLPKSVDGLDGIETNLSWQKLGETIKALDYQRIDLSLPKFKFEQAESLVQPLQAIGMKLPFDPDHSDLSGISSEEPLYISGVLHKAFVSVDEHGTEAAAATAVGIRAGAAFPSHPPIVVKVDHPFLLIIRHNTSGDILFMGRVMNPAG